MDSAKLNDWMQVIGIFALVASLIFVGLEMRQSQRIALSAAYQARADSSMVLRMAALESERLQSAIVKSRQDGSLERLTPEELVVLRARWNGQLVYLENMHWLERIRIIPFLEVTVIVTRNISNVIFLLQMRDI